MDFSTSIAAASMNMSNARFMTEVSVAMMGKVLDVAQTQEQTLEQMMAAVVPPSDHILDVYA